MEFDNHPDYFTNSDDEPVNEPKNPNVIQFDNVAPTPRSIPAPEEENKPEPPRKQKKHHPLRKFFWITGLVVVIALGVIVWARYINPYETDIIERGYVVDFKRQGIIFKTWEGQMLVQSALTDASRPYSRDFVFSVDDEALAAQLAALNGTGKQVTLTYKRYWGVLPWRGATQCIVTGIKIP